MTAQEQNKEHELVPQRSQETDSLVKRLAGPSSGKAGLANDQSEINRVIADASKGSQFYENEKKKDRELTERINKVLKLRDEVVKGVDLQRLGANLDRLLAELESHRDLTQFIVHVDMDAFYASVELLGNPSLQGKPFGVGRGVLTTASYEARKYGVRSGMPGFIAKKLCPELIIISNHFHKYQEMSDRVMDIFKLYDPNMFPAGCDEGYLNITPYCNEHSISAENCVQEMRRVVFEETKLTVSAGIAPNKMLAKICSDKNKPNGQFHLPFDREKILEFMRDLSIRKIPGIGRVNERLLDAVGIKTCGDIYEHRAIIALMDKQFGLHFLLSTHLGIASNEVHPPQREERKSIGAERTFPPLDDRAKLLQMLDHIASELESDMTRTGWAGKTVTLKYKLDTYQVFTRAKSLSRYVSAKEDLFSIGKELFLAEGPLKLRLIGLRVTKLKDLRAPSPTGIKRFFGSTSTVASPRKRQKLDHPEANDDASASVHDEREEHHMDAMPGYYEHEHEETTHDIIEIEESEDDCIGQLNVKEKEKGDPTTLLLHQPQPHLRTKPTSSYAKLEGSIQTRVVSESTPLGRERSKSDVGISHSGNSSSGPNNKEMHVCPICSRTLQTDNQGFNAHIDFCLSRSAIQEAQAESTQRSTTSIKSGESSTIKLKPRATSANPPPSNKGWDFLMAQKETKPRSKGRKARK